ncbi:hypothetical protein L6R52_07295 [Myxococcota bacterium]|nr:hypothetical protein [Myxococcota bacterium]
MTALALTFALAAVPEALAAGEAQSHEVSGDEGDAPAKGDAKEDAKGATKGDGADDASDDPVDEDADDGASYAPDDEDGEPGGARRPSARRKKARRDEDEPPKYHNQRGSVIAGGTVGISKDQYGTRYAGGLSLGYAFVTGVVPSVRGLISKSGDHVGGEIAATLTLSPPLSISFVPFAMGEVGRLFSGGASAWMYAGGGGLYLGSPEDGSALQIGYLFRRITFEGRNYDASGPLIAISVQL